jgi:hypothetical protein
LSYSTTNLSKNFENTAPHHLYQAQSHRMIALVPRIQTQFGLRRQHFSFTPYCCLR